MVEHGFEVETLSSLLSAQEWLAAQGDRPGVLLIPADLEGVHIQAVVESLAPRLSGGTGAMVLVGAVAGRAEARELSDLGFLWLVRDPFTAEELHLGAVAALGTTQWSDVRKSPRVPVSLVTDVAKPGGIVPARICDVSAGGMFLELAQPPEVGTAIMVEMTLGARAMMLHGIVTHSSKRATPAQEVGVGVSFDRLEEGDARAIVDYVEARLGSVRL